MAHFVDGYGSKLRGYPLINLDLVAELRSHGEGTDKSFDCFSSTGEALGRISTYDVPRGNSTVIPNTQPIRFMGFWIDDNGDLQSCDLPIVGWKLDDGDVEPIVPDETGYKAHCLTDGRVWWIPGDSYFTEHSELVAYVRSNMEENQRRIEAAKAAAKEATAEA